MARKFLYAIAVLTALFIVGRLTLNFWFHGLAEVAFIPSVEFTSQPPLPAESYRKKTMWVSHPAIAKGDPSRWTPHGAGAVNPVDAAVFFVQPTSHLSRASWNAAIDDKAARELGDRNVRLLASAFNEASALYAPLYRQATFGAFLTADVAGQKALDLAYADVDAAFTQFLSEAEPTVPIVLAGDSQGSYLLRRLIKDRIAGKPVATRVAAAYLIGWPVSIKHDLPLMQMPACASPEQSRCVVSWMSFAEPAEPDEMVRTGQRVLGLDGQKLDRGDIICTNPLTGKQGGSADASSGLGTLKPDMAFADGTIVSQITPARCTKDGWLSIGAPPEMGPLVMPGNNYHIYDIPLFWMNLRADFARRVAAWEQAR